MYHHQYPGKRPRNKQEISTDGPSMPLRTRLTSLTTYSVTGFVSGMRYRDPLTDKEMRRYRLAAARSCGPTYSTRARHQGSPCSEDVCLHNTLLTTGASRGARRRSGSRASTGQSRVARDDTSLSPRKTPSHRLPCMHACPWLSVNTTAWQQAGDAYGLACYVPSAVRVVKNPS